jgi:protein TonB
MSNPVIFRDLPATFPETDRYQRPSLISSVVFHVLLITSVILVPLMFTRNVADWRLTAMLVAPLPPPPAAVPAPVNLVEVAKPLAVKPAVQREAVAGELISPIAVPKDIALVVDEPIEFPSGVIGGVPGGVPGGVVGGVLGGILSNNARLEMAAPPPPPPPPPLPAMQMRQPIRVGGNVQEPQIIKLVPPVYPPIAVKARVYGTVVLEATLTAEGNVEQIRVISGHPLLINAAIDCVKQWQYEPTYLNGQPVEIILTAIVAFKQRPATW